MSVENLNEIEKYLIFKVGGIFFGTPLLGVKEIVKPIEYQPVPQAIESCLGVINLRGQVMGVLDINKTLGTNPSTNDGNLLIFETNEGPIAALVDDVVSVSDINDGEIEKKPTIKTKVEQNYLIGIAKMEKKLVNLVDLSKVLTGNQLNDFQQSVSLAS